MKILFVMRHSGYVRNFESTLRLLSERGHRVVLGFPDGGHHALLDASDVGSQLTSIYPNFARETIPVRDDHWGYASRQLRLDLDYLRYLEPRYRDANKLRERAARDASNDTVVRARAWPFSTRVGRMAVGGWLRSQLRAIPTDARIDAFLDVHRPDVLAVTPLIEPGSPQAEYLRSARRIGVRTMLCVASWDNLTNKGLIHGDPDRVAVWNGAMKQEAVELHGIAAARVVVTGAQPFDHWFGWQPSTTREEFCLRVGLDHARPFVLYLCSSKFIAPDEVTPVRRWLQALRAHPALQGVGVLVRPHPQNAEQWQDVVFDGDSHVAIWPRRGAAPSDAANRSEYFDSMFHSAAVIGVNTTAEIESAIVGRSVLTMMTPEFRETQEGTLHFAHLRGRGEGLVSTAATLPAHVEQLAETVANPSGHSDRRRRFLESFVRPYGLESAATPRLVNALEMLAAQPPRQVAAAAGLWFQHRHVANLGHRLRHEAELKQEAKTARARNKPRVAGSTSAAES